MDSTTVQIRKSVDSNADVLLPVFRTLAAISGLAILSTGLTRHFSLATLPTQLAGPSSTASASTTASETSPESTTTTILVNPGNTSSPSAVGSTTITVETTLAPSTTLSTDTAPGNLTTISSPTSTPFNGAADYLKPIGVMGLFLLGAAMIHSGSDAELYL